MMDQEDNIQYDYCQDATVSDSTYLLYWQQDGVRFSYFEFTEYTHCVFIFTYTSIPTHQFYMVIR